MILQEIERNRNAEVSADIRDLVNKELLLTNSLTDTINQHIEEEKKKVISKDPLDNLPIESKEMLKQMEVLFENILRDKEHIEKVELLTLKDIIENKIPQVVLNFTAFNIHDRIEMKNINGNTPIDICNNTFSNFLSVFIDAEDSIKNNKLRNLSIMERVSSGIRNNKGM